MKLKVLIVFFSISICGLSQTPNDCSGALTICGDSSLEIEPDGIGFDEFSLPGNITPPCYTFDSSTIWFRFDFVTDGIFTFDLEPEVRNADYDFAIYGPTTDCTNLGESIRCSSTNPDAANISGDTGLNLIETDTEEGPGEDGNGYLKFIDVLAGETYYLLVDRAEGSGPFNIFYTGTAALPVSVMANQPNDLFGCDSDGTQDGFTPFNLETQTSVIKGTQPNATVTYHLNANDAGIGQNPLASPYSNVSNPQLIYARIENNNSCFDITSFNLNVGDLNITQPEDVVICSENPTFLFLLSTVLNGIVDDPSVFTFSFHSTEGNAQNNVFPLGAAILLTNTPATIYIRVANRSDPSCFDVTSFDGSTAVVTQPSKPTDITDCEENSTGQLTVDLNTKDSEVLAGLPPGQYEIFYYDSQSDLINGGNEIISPYSTTQNPQTIYVSLLNVASGCYGYTQFNIISTPSPIPTFEDEPYFYCANNTGDFPISVSPDFDYYVWSMGEEGANLNTIFINEPGTYSVTVTNSFNCEGTGSTTVILADIATITDIVITDFSGENNQIEILITGIGEFEYAIDLALNYQDSNIFIGLSAGYHTVYVRSKLGCGTISKKILILDYPRYFTPNNDSYHDYWHIIGIEQFPDTKIKIYDRFGKLLKNIKASSKGWDGTDDKGKPTASNDYWFTIDIKDKPQYRGHFSLKR